MLRFVDERCQKHDHLPQSIHVLQVLGVEFAEIHILKVSQISAAHGGQSHRHGVCVAVKER